MKNLLIGFLLGLIVSTGAWRLAGAAPSIERRVVLENARVEVTERNVLSQGVREPYTRPSDQVIVFLNDTEYERIDSETGEKTVRTRKAGEVIWHDKGELAPRLVNVGKDNFRSLIIALK